MAKEKETETDSDAERADSNGTKEGRELRTHRQINHELCGELVELKNGYAKVKLATTHEMAADEKGLVHGGFVFSAADFAAMAAVNHPNVVLVSSECRFLSPVKVGDIVMLEAKELYKETRKRKIHVAGYFEEIKVFEGDFMAVVLERHVLDLKLLKEEG
ncbi:hotdog domain-containing protein [Hydrogenimonas sp.]